MAYNSLSGTIIGPDKIVAKEDGSFTQLTASVSGTYINASGSAVSFSTIGTIGGSGNGTIGSAEDGTYTDGLFTDFTSGTLIGVPIDRFNELFKSLVPPPAPNISRKDATQDGTDAFLSFGASNNMESDGTPYFSVGTAAGFTAVDKGEIYETATSGNNLRRSIFRFDTNITGFINFHVTASVLGSYTNYEADAFGNADTGSLKLYINSTSTAAHTLNLATATGTGNPGAGNSSSLNTSGSGFTNISTAKAATDANNNTFDLFKHRTAKYIVHSASQRRGWNYAYVEHTVGAATYTTNYVEWVNDDNAQAVSVASSSLANITLSGSRYISGVQYNTSATADYQFLIANFYKMAYTLATVTCTDSTSNASIANTTMPHIGSDDENKIVSLTQSLSTTDTIILNESIGATASVTHVFKGTATGNTNMSGFLIFTPSVSTATNTAEYFRDEATFRLPSGSYATQPTVTTGSWNSQTHMTGSGNHADGLQIYNQRLVSPLNTTNSGNFSTITNTESGNPNYSGVSGTRTFYRAFKRVGGSVQDVGVRIKGSATIVSSGASLGANGNIRVLVKTPGKTGWMNLATNFSFNNVSDDDGANELGLDSTVDGTGAYNVATLGTKVVANGEFFLVKIEADAGWTGYLTEISVTFGAGTGSPTYGVSLDEINETTSNNGSTAKLSFGASKAISGYTSVTTSPNINGAVDVNSTWSPNTGLTNERLGIYDKTIDITAILNNSSEAYRIDSGSQGVLELYINGAERHSINFTSFGSGDSLNSSGSGFTSVSAIAYPTYTNNVRDYTRPYRTGSIKVDTNDQRLGWNFVRVIHSGSWGELSSSYIEWINDNDSSSIGVTGGDLTDFSNDGTFYYSSGIKFFATAPSASFTITSSNNYLNVYDNDSSDAIDFNDSLTNVSITAMTASGGGISTLTDANGVSAYPALLTSSTDTQTGSVNYNVTLNFTPSTSLVGTFIAGGDIHTASISTVKFLNPPSNGNNNTYSSFTTSDFVTSSHSGFLRFSGSETNTNLTSAEYFQGETYRLINRSITYLSQSDVTTGSNAWNPQTPVNNTGSYNSHADGLIVFDEKLVSPTAAGASGDCRSVADGGTLQAPTGNVNYSISNLDVATRTYVRYFRNTSGTTKTGFTVTFRGSGSLDDLAASYAGGAFKFEYKVPHTDSANSTAWQDGGKALSFSGNRNVDGNGGAQGSDSQFPLTINTGGTSISVSLNGGNWLNNEYLVIRVRASASWSGYLDRIEVS